EVLRPVQEFASRGNRVVVAMTVDPHSLPDKDAFTAQPESDPKKKSKDKDGKPPDPPIQTMWQVRIDVDRAINAPHPLYIAKAEGWTVLDKVGDHILTAERSFGKGTVVLMAESHDFQNESLVNLTRLRQLSRILGPYQRIVFDENHLGIEESGSVMGMARQFRLMGLALGLGICAAIFIWRNASGFPPPVPMPPGARYSGRTSFAGLLTLLKRHIQPSELAAVCWKEWLATNRREVNPDRL